MEEMLQHDQAPKSCIFNLPNVHIRIALLILGCTGSKSLFGVGSFFPIFDIDFQRHHKSNKIRQGVSSFLEATSISTQNISYGTKVHSPWQSVFLQEVLNTILKLALAIPLSDILAYAKLSRAYFNLLDILCLQHIQTLAARDSNTFSFIVSSLDAGLKALECSVSTTCSTAIDNLAGYYFKAINSEDSPSQAAQVLCVQTIWTVIFKEKRGQT